MISDTLHDAAAEIRDYLKDYPEMYREFRPRLLTLLEQMETLRNELDNPPPADDPSPRKSADILILPTVKTERY